MSSEKFCLRWNDFERNISSAFRELRDDKDFFDVTIACDDEQIQAHKVILSACSPFFRNVLRRNPHQHPLLYLKNVRYTDLQSVLNFMYHGEVNVAQEDLNSFLSVAEDLKVKGLTQNNSDIAGSKDASSFKQPKEREPPARSLQRPPEREPPPTKRSQQEHHVQQSLDDEIQEVVPIKSEPRDIDHSRPSQHITPVQQYRQPQEVALPEDQGDSLIPYQQEEEETFEDYGLYNEQYGHQDMDMGIGQVAQTGKGGGYPTPNSPSELLNYCTKSTTSNSYVCSICGQFSHSRRYLVRNHVESKHFSEAFEYHCEFCDKICKTKKGLEVHIFEKHKNYNYTTTV